MIKVAASNLTETANKVKSEVKKLNNDVKGVKTMMASGAVGMNETRMEELVKEMKDDMLKEMKDENEEVVQKIKDEINNEMDVLRDEVKDVKRLLVQMPKQRSVSALVRE